MAHPAHPAECRRLSDAARHSKATVLFDFVEVFNPHSFRIRAMLRRLGSYRSVIPHDTRRLGDHPRSTETVRFFSSFWPYTQLNERLSELMRNNRVEVKM